MAVKKTMAKPVAKAAKSAPKPTAAKYTGAKSTKNAALSLTSMSPGLTVNDVETSLTWYRDVLGFEAKERWERDGKLLGVEMTAGKAWLMLGQDDWQKGRDRVKGQGVRVYCVTDQDIDRLAASIKARGGRLTQEPKDQAWGMRDLAIEDQVMGIRIPMPMALLKASLAEKRVAR